MGPPLAKFSYRPLYHPINEYSLLGQNIHKNQSEETRHTDQPTPLPLIIFPELSVDVELLDPETALTVRVTGRADWGIGYGKRTRAAKGAAMGMIEVKRREDFSKGESQLLAYLAIIRERRIQHGQKESAVQGFWTDGDRYAFMAIDNDGSIRTSTILTAGLYLDEPRDIRTIFNFIVKIFET